MFELLYDEVRAVGIISLHKLTGGKVLSAFDQVEQEHILQYLLNKAFSYISSGPSTYIDKDTGMPMNSTSFFSKDGTYVWKDEDFFRIRDDVQLVPDVFVQHVSEFYEEGKIPNPKDNCWKYGKRPRASFTGVLEQVENPVSSI